MSEKGGIQSEKRHQAADLRGPRNVWLSTASGMPSIYTGMLSASGPVWGPPTGGLQTDITPYGVALGQSGGWALPSGLPVPESEIVVLNVNSGVSQQFDLQGSGFFGGRTHRNKFVRMVSESAGNIHYAYFQSTGGSIDRTATGGGSGAAAWVASQIPTDEVPAGRFIVIQPQTNGVVRMWITNSIIGHPGDIR